MHYLIALIYFLLALVGIDGYGSHTIVTHSAANGIDVLYSKTRIIAGIADVACLSSASGRCHYQLLPADCGVPDPVAATAPTCAPDAAKQFAVAVGAGRELAGWPASFTLCVSPDEQPVAADCERLSGIDPLAR